MATDVFEDGKTKRVPGVRVDVEVETMASDKQQCPDGGVCHHDCKERCFRVETCEPLSGVYPDNVWPAGVRLSPRPVPVDEFGVPLDHHHDGRPVTLETLCRLEPAWATSQIRGLRTEVEHMEVRLHDEQACGDYSEELRDRTALKEAADAFQVRITELDAENTRLRQELRVCHSQGGVQTVTESLRKLESAVMSVDAEHRIAELEEDLEEAKYNRCETRNVDPTIRPIRILCGAAGTRIQELKTRAEELEARLQERCDEAAFQHGVDPLPCCGSNSCDIRPPPGQGNNGPCRCEESALRMAVRKLRKERMEYIFALRKVRQAKQDVEAGIVDKAAALMELQEKYNGLDQAFAREAEHGRNRRARIRELETLAETLRKRALRALGLAEGDLGFGWGWIEAAVRELRSRVPRGTDEINEVVGLATENEKLQKVGQGWREHSKELGNRIKEKEAELTQARALAVERGDTIDRLEEDLREALDKQQEEAD